MATPIVGAAELEVIAVASAHLAAEPSPGTRKRWRWLTHAFR